MNDDGEGLPLGVEGFVYADLYEPARLRDLSSHFDGWLESEDSAAFGRLRTLRTLDEPASRDVSEMLLAVAPHLGRYVARLFRIEDASSALSEHILEDQPVFRFRKDFARKRVLKPSAGAAWRDRLGAAKHISSIAWAATDVVDAGADASRGQVPDPDDEELYVARATLALHELDETARKVAKAGGVSWTSGLQSRMAAVREALESDEDAAAALAEALASAESPEDRDRTLIAEVCSAIEAALAARRLNPDDPASRWASLRMPKKTNFEELVPLRHSQSMPPPGGVPHELAAQHAAHRQRIEPFELTDPRASRREVNAEIDYCLYCHDRDKDSCSKGLRDKHGALKRNPLGVELAGCPLDEKISEMHLLYKAGNAIGALATILVDNPMAPGTGHRICNDCMKGCVYQTQDPVNIPQVETRVLVDVLELPWGFEIYSLLTRWNPLSLKRPYALPYNGKNVMVVGLGPAGYTLCHYLVNEGFGVVGVDGLKLEPLSTEWIGSADRPPKPVRDVHTLREPLETRRMLGFGGVSEYGITVRWDKNFLSLIYLNLLRRRLFRGYGGVRFGGTLTLEDAWDLGFDHVAIAAGAGKPTYINMRNNLIRGVRKASDFLMALQLTGAYKRSSLANVQVRLPAVVIGGGLTAIDTATELLAFYVVQAERTHRRYETLLQQLGEETLRRGFDAEELSIIDEVRSHGRALIEERELADREGREPRIQQMLDDWGGVRIVYRRRLRDSPAYRLNHEEVSHSLQEGVRYLELLSPLEAHPDVHGAVESVTFERMKLVDDGRLRGTGQTLRIPARTLCIAAGTSPNVSYEREYPDTFELDDYGYFANHRAVTDERGSCVRLEPTRDGSGFFTSYRRGNKLVSYYGDNHPKYAGSVVKAMASAKHGYEHVAALFADALGALRPEEQASRQEQWKAFSKSMSDLLQAKVQDIRRLAPGIVEVVIRAPLAARKFQPGQFYRLQNFESYAPQLGQTPLVMEGLALTGASVDREHGLLSTIALEMGTSSRMLAALKKDEPVILMGPTGMPTETPGGETVLLAGGGLGNAVLFSIARALRANGSRVIYFAGYRTRESLFKREEIEAVTDQVIWSTDTGEPIQPARVQDRHFRGNIVQAIVAYQEGRLGDRTIDLREVDRIIAIGSDRMMAAIKEARRGILSPYFKSCHKAIGSINSPMQCMLKAICAQCLQKVIDPETGRETVVYTCSNQDLYLDEVDFKHLNARLRQNSAEEKLSNLWLGHLLEHHPVPMA